MLDFLELYFYFHVKTFTLADSTQFVGFANATSRETLADSLGERNRKHKFHKMKNIILFIIIIQFSCNSKGEKYFEYDEIEYYKSEIEEGQIGELYDNQKKSKIDSLKMEVILGETPKSISDTTFINNLESLGYTKSKIEIEKFKSIDDIFMEKKHSELYATACIYVYRDILVFKKKSKVIGIAKICFGCDANVIVGTKSNTEEFGMSGDYEKLRKILRGK